MMPSESNVPHSSPARPPTPRRRRTGIRRRPLPAYIPCCLVFLALLVVYLLTLAPDLVWQDQGDYQYQAALGSLSRPGDAVRVHPLYIVVAHALGRPGWFSYAYAANLASALFAALTVASLFLLVYQLAGRLWPALLAALSYGLAHTPWFVGVQAQSYSMATAAITGGLLLMLAYERSGKGEYLLWMGLIFGLGASVHLISQIAWVIVLIWLIERLGRRKLSGWAVAGMGLFWLIGAGLFWAVLWQEYLRTGDWIATWQSAIWGRWGPAVFNLRRLGPLAYRSVQLLVLNYPTPLLLLAGPGLWYSLARLPRRAAAWLLLVLGLAYVLFAVRYDVPNQNHFFLPAYALLSVYIGLGFEALCGRRRRLGIILTAAGLLLMPPAYAVMAQAARSRQIPLGTRRHIPYRDVYRYYLEPWQQDQTGPRRFATEVFDRLPAGAILLADHTTIPPLLYLQHIEQRRPDVRVFLELDRQALIRILPAGGRVFTVSNVKDYRPDWVTDPNALVPFALSPTENIYEIRMDQPAAPAGRSVANQEVNP
ncbi:MAG: DUF2723 domain-containing protein [Sedimentisphaerales bacterium]|nr:DUF2723 domain-containing protein [Sedimentisphaerales bacterium]